MVGAQKNKVNEVAWVKAHDGVPGNEYADFKAKETGSIGRLTHERQTATTAGTRQSFYCDRISKQVKSWDRKSMVHRHGQRTPEKQVVQDTVNSRYKNTRGCRSLRSREIWGQIRIHLCHVLNTHSQSIPPPGSLSESLAHHRQNQDTSATNVPTVLPSPITCTFSITNWDFDIRSHFSCTYISRQYLTALVPLLKAFLHFIYM